MIKDVLQIMFLQYFLSYHDMNYLQYGLNVLGALFSGFSLPESRLFPRITLCDFQIREALHPRDSHRYTVQCVLPLNLFSQQIFTFIWFWYMMVFIVSIFDVVVWVTRFFPDKQYNYIKRRFTINET